MPQSDAVLEKVEDLDPAAAQQALDLLLPRLKALDKDKLATASTDVQRAAVYAAAVGRWAKREEIRARFALLPKELFDQRQLDDLEPAALACWYVAVQLLSAKARSTKVQLPLALVQSATIVRQRMLNLLDYHLGDDAQEGPEIADIKRGSGHADLANDLQRLAKLWLAYHDDIKDDRKHYQAGDGDAARQHAQAIIKLLGAASKDPTEWTDLAARAWTLLLAIYVEVTDTTTWLWRHEPVKPTFISLYAVGRKTARGRGKKKPLPVTAPEPPAEPTEPPAEPTE